MDQLSPPTHSLAHPLPFAPGQSDPLPWIAVASGAPYFVTDVGEPWTPIGQNDAIEWVELNGLFRRRDLAAVEAHLRWLKAHGVTVLRLMLEYCHKRNRYFEQPAGTYKPNMVRLWDDLFALCEKVGMRILLTPMDTFFQWIRWKQHPYNVANGGPCADRSQMMVCPEARKLVKARLAFATERWGNSGVLFAWDLWNEMHPAQGNNEWDCFHRYIEDVGPWLRDLETRLHGRAHLQTVSVFGPELRWKPWLNEPIFRHPLLDFANSHFYEEGTIDDPRDTVAPAIAAGRLVREALAEIADDRPFFDTEHGPIHTFKDRRTTLPEAFDDEYFRHMQWAHFASGGAGGGMRWPNRNPHTLTPGMRKAQKSLADFLPLIDWPRFRRRNLHGEIVLDTRTFCAFACGDEAQVVAWLLRRTQIGADGRVKRDAPAIAVGVQVPRLASGRYRVTFWNTEAGTAIGTEEVGHDGGALSFETPPCVTDLAIAVRRVA